MNFDDGTREAIVFRNWLGEPPLKYYNYVDVQFYVLMQIMNPVIKDEAMNHD